MRRQVVVDGEQDAIQGRVPEDLLGQGGPLEAV